MTLGISIISLVNIIITVNIYMAVQNSNSRTRPPRNTCPASTRVPRSPRVVTSVQNINFLINRYFKLTSPILIRKSTKNVFVDLNQYSRWSSVVTKSVEILGTPTIT